MQSPIQINQPVFHCAHLALPPYAVAKGSDANGILLQSRRQGSVFATRNSVSAHGKTSLIIHDLMKGRWKEPTVMELKPWGGMLLSTLQPCMHIYIYYIHMILKHMKTKQANFLEWCWRRCTRIWKQTSWSRRKVMYLGIGESFFDECWLISSTLSTAGGGVHS